MDDAMETREQRGTMSRAGWPSGPWDDEPDQVQFVTHGYPCMAIRGPQGAWCGYIGVPATHPWSFGERTDEAMREVYGNVIYTDVGGYWLGEWPFAGSKSTMAWLGFDCNHIGDIAPKYASETRDRRAEYRTLAFVRSEIEKLAGYAVREIATTVPAPTVACSRYTIDVDPLARLRAPQSSRGEATASVERPVVKNDAMEELATRIMEALAVSGETQAVHLPEIVRMLRAQVMRDQLRATTASALALHVDRRAKETEARCAQIEAENGRLTALLRERETASAWATLSAVKQTALDTDVCEAAEALRAAEASLTAAFAEATMLRELDTEEGKAKRVAVSARYEVAGKVYAEAGAALDAKILARKTTALAKTTEARREKLVAENERLIALLRDRENADAWSAAAFAESAERDAAVCEAAEELLASLERCDSEDGEDGEDIDAVRCDRRATHGMIADAAHACDRHNGSRMPELPYASAATRLDAALAARKARR